MPQDHITDFDVEDSVQVEWGISEWDSRGLVVRCALCHHDHCSDLKPIVDSDGNEYETYYRHEGSVYEDAPFFCKHPCWEEEIDTERSNTKEDITNW